MSLLSEINDHISSNISLVEEKLIIGFLPLETDLADKTVGEVRVRLAPGRLADAERLFRLAPAAFAFALIHTPSRHCESGGDFWGVLGEYLGVHVQASDRGRLANSFRSACRRLGLLDGTVKTGHQVHVAPFLFQAGILHRWVKPLADAVRQTLQTEAAPDIEDERALLDFTKSVHGRIHPATASYGDHSVVHPSPGILDGRPDVRLFQIRQLLDNRFMA